MNIIIFGPPGSGKGTQAVKIAAEFNVPHISTGDIFRQNIKDETELGLQVKSILDAGQLVPDEVTNDLMKDRLGKEDCANGFILDGFPRNLIQAKALDAFTSIDHVLNVKVSDEEVTKRLTGRRYCHACKKTYHILFNPPQVEGKCECGTDLIIRDDDKLEVVQDRLRVYHEQTKPVLDYYVEKGIIKDVNGEQSIDAVFDEILTTLGIVKSSSASPPS